MSPRSHYQLLVQNLTLNDLTPNVEPNPNINSNPNINLNLSFDSQHKGFDCVFPTKSNELSIGRWKC